MAQSSSSTQVIERLKSLRNPENIAGMARFGINSNNTLGISVVTLRKLAREIGKSHELALELWDSSIHEARILASLVDIPARVTPAQMDAWAAAFDSWDVCDTCCSNLFSYTPYAYQKALAWCREDQEFVRRAGFALMAALSVHDKRADDSKFIRFLPVIKKNATDDRNFVKKAVNWALRQIGKRNPALNARAIGTAREMQRMEEKSARWIASDALRELEGDAVQKRLKEKARRA